MRLCSLTGCFGCGRKQGFPCHVKPEGSGRHKPDAVRAGHNPSNVRCRFGIVFFTMIRFAKGFGRRPTTKRACGKAGCPGHCGAHFKRLRPGSERATRGVCVMSHDLVRNPPDSSVGRFNHYPGYGTVYDPCAGSGTVDAVCRKLGIPSFSVEIKVPTPPPEADGPDLFSV